MTEEIVLARGVQGRDRSFYYAIMAADREALLAYVDHMMRSDGVDPTTNGMQLYDQARTGGWDYDYLAVACPDQGPNYRHPLVSFKTRDDVPGTNVPCACGNPRHWAIWYTTEDAASTEHKGG